LFKQSLSTISTLPFHLLQDVWRWKVYRGLLQPQWNNH